METLEGLADRLAPDSVEQLQEAARMRFAEAEKLHEKHSLAAVYIYGYCIEMCLGAAYFQGLGFAPDDEIDRDVRRERMTDARRRKLMGSDPHPLADWARLLRATALDRNPSMKVRNRCDDAIEWATKAYRHWRPELRYKTVVVHEGQLHEVRQAASWFIENQLLLGAM